MDIGNLAVLLSFYLYAIDGYDVDAELVDDEFAELVGGWVFLHVLQEAVLLPLHVLVHIEWEFNMEGVAVVDNAVLYLAVFLAAFHCFTQLFP